MSEAMPLTEGELDELREGVRHDPMSHLYGKDVPPHARVTTIPRLLATLDAERAKVVGLERELSATRRHLDAAEDAAGHSPLSSRPLSMTIRDIVKERDAATAWLAAKEAPATPTPATLGDDRGEG
jgi:hypothetical protein